MSLAVAASVAPLAAHAACTTGGSFSSNVSGTQDWGANDCSIATGINISSGSPALAVTANVGTLTNNGVIRGGETGLRISSTYTAAVISNNGTISANSSYGIRNLGTIGTLTNVGQISASYAGIFNDNTSVITSLNNAATGTITGNNFGINNSSNATISTLTNAGNVSGNVTGIYNGYLSTISSLQNAGTISGSTYGVQTDNGSRINALTNTSTGTISGGTGFLAGNLTPSGSISVGTLTNAGTINGTTNVGVGTSSNASIGSLTNTGDIRGSLGAVGNAGTIGAISNSGTITSPGYAIYNAPTGTLGPITNSGLIAGTIGNLSTRSITINGASGAVFGTLTGASGGTGSADVGMISSTASNLVFGYGNLLLNNNVNVGSQTITNTGATLQVNNHLNITGNYTQAAGASLLIGVGNGALSNGVTADTGYGRLVVSGNAQIASGSSVGLKSLNTYAFAPGQRFVVMQAGSSTYNASTLNYTAAAFNGTITGATVVDSGKDNLVLTLVATSTPTDTTTPLLRFATTPNAIAALNGLYSYGGINQSMLDVFNPAQALGNTVSANRAGGQLSPTAVQSAAVGGSDAAHRAVLDVASSHLDSLRLAQSDGPGRTGVSTGERSYDPALWGQFFGGKATQDLRDNVSGYHANYRGLLMGADIKASEFWRTGALLSYAKTDVDNDDSNTGSSASVDSYGLAVYAGFDGKPWYVNLTASLTQQRYDTTRAISFTGFSGIANGSFKGLQGTASAQSGYPLALGNDMTLTPTAGLTYSKLRQDGYTETGGNGAALAVNATSTSSFKSDLGVKLDRKFPTSYGEVTPSLQLRWRHEFQDSRLHTGASFAADTTGATSFTTVGASPIKDTGVMVLGVKVARSKNLSLLAYYTLEAGQGYKSQTGEVRVRWEY